MSTLIGEVIVGRRRVGEVEDLAEHRGADYLLRAACCRAVMGLSSARLAALATALGVSQELQEGLERPPLSRVGEGEGVQQVAHQGEVIFLEVREPPGHLRGRGG